MKVLLVDDSKAIRFKLRGILESMGYEVVAEASNGLEALVAWEKFQPELVTLDIVMPEMDGLTTLAELMKRSTSVKVIMVTSAASVSNMLEARKLGAAHFLIKPFTLESVSEVLQHANVAIPKAA